MNRVRSGSSGYTVVETMIFLAVSSMLFISAMLLVTGQQAKTEFNTNVREFQTKLQGVMGNVASGYYNNPGSFTCEASVTGPVITNSPSTQGQNSDCTYVGQWITLPSNDTFTFTSYAGLRRTGSPPREVVSLFEAIALPITSTAEDYNLPAGMTATMKLAGTSTDVATLQVVTTFGQYKGGVLGSGAQSVDIHAITSAGIDTPNPANGVQICLIDGDRVGIIIVNNGSAILSIGSSCP